MGFDNLSIISFNSSRKGLQTLSPNHRPSYLQQIFENAKPDICFLPGDDTSAKLNVIRGYNQFMLPHDDNAVLLYDTNKVAMRQQRASLNAIGPLPGLDLNQMVVPEVEVSSLLPYKQVVKSFSMVSWKYDYFEKAVAHVRAETLVESIFKFSQCLAFYTEKPVLIGGEMRIDFSVLKEIVNRLSKTSQEEFLSTMQPIMSEYNLLPSATKYTTRDFRHLFMMKVFRCKQSGISKTREELRSHKEVVPDCFVASKQLHLEEAALLDVEKVTGRQISMNLLREHKPTTTKMEIPVRPPRHHGG